MPAEDRQENRTNHDFLCRCDFMYRCEFDRLASSIAMVYVTESPSFGDNSSARHLPDFRGQLSVIGGHTLPPDASDYL